MSSLPEDNILQQDRLIGDGEQNVLPQQSPAIAPEPYSAHKVNWKPQPQK